MSALFKSVCYERTKTSDIEELAIGIYRVFKAAALEKDTVPVEGTKLKYMDFTRAFLQHFSVRDPERKVRDTTLPYLTEEDASTQQTLILSLLKETYIVPLAATEDATLLAAVKALFTTYKTLDNSQSKASRWGGFAPRVETPTRVVAPFDPVSYSDIPSLDNPVDNPAWEREHAPIPSDTKAPALQTLIAHKTVITLTYDENLVSTGIPSAADFLVGVNGTTTSVYAVAVSGKKVILTLPFRLLDTDTVTVSYICTKPAIALQDAAGNKAVTYGPRAVTNTTPARVAPVLQSATAVGTALVMTYDKVLMTPPQDTTVPFIVSVNAGVVNVPSVVVSEKTVTLTLSNAIVYGDTITVSYDSTSKYLQDTDDNAAVSLVDAAVTNTTPMPAPAALASATVDATQVLLHYDAQLDTTAVPEAAAFTVKDGAAAVVVSSVGIAGTVCTLTLADAVTSIADVTVSYTKGTTPLKDTYGQDCANLTAVVVTNVTPTA